MKKNVLSIAMGVGLLFSTSAIASQSPWSLGVGAAYSPNVYIGTPSDKTVIPILGYEGEHFFFRGFSTGYRFNPRGSAHNIVIRAIYDPRSFKPSDSDNAQMKLLDERDAAVIGGMSYQYLSLIGMLEASVGGDISGVHNGVYGEIAWRLPLRFSLGMITPSIGYSYNDNKLNQHLYGVSQQESDRTGGAISSFNINGSGQYFVGVSANFALTNNIRVNGGIRYTNLEDDIEKSPILDSQVSTTANIGVAYTF